MRKRRLLWRLFFSYLALELAVLAGCIWFILRWSDNTVAGMLQERLSHVAAAIADDEIVQFSPERSDELRAIVDRLAAAAQVRLTLILPDGRVLYDTLEQAAQMENHADRPEVRAALEGRPNVQSRFSKTLGYAMIYFAQPVRRQGKMAGVARASVANTAADEARRRLQAPLILGGLAIVLISSLMRLLQASRTSRALEELSRQARELTAGNGAGRIFLPEHDEVAELAKSFNLMARRLEQHATTIDRQGDEQAIVFSNMTEGVLAVDDNLRIVTLNPAAAELIGASAAKCPGRMLQEVVRSSDLRNFVAHVLAEEQPLEMEVKLHGERDKTVRARGSRLQDESGARRGAMIVLDDVTDYRKLENIRRDFVANVSHELKTPIASIKGFVETLLDGAMKNSADAERFLQIIAKQADRLDAIIEDLLSLAQIEESEDAGSLPLEPRSLRDVLEAAIADCQPKAETRRVTVELECPGDIMAAVNSPLLEQAVMNLLDNAIKYSEPGGAVTVSAAENDEIAIRVRDHGCGMEQHHLPRIFERFYRVDKARSRKLGGTGLGLSIVKHIVLAHRGRVTVESSPGKGSLFVIFLPKPAE